MEITLKSLLCDGVNKVPGQEDHLQRIWHVPIGREDFLCLDGIVRAIGVSREFINVIETFDTPAGQTPAGFRCDLKLMPDGLLEAELVRDISYDKNCVKRPTKLLFSADSADPYEVRPIAPLIANLTCNPGIVYDRFINNPKANKNGLYKTREEVLADISAILGPGCDISVELNNPFNTDWQALLDEAAQFREMFTKYRVVIKVPHTGPVNAQNYRELTEGDKSLKTRFDEPMTADALYGHNLALFMHEYGYRVNFTLMFEPYQTQLALQARPYFINSFVRARGLQTKAMKALIAAYDASGDAAYIEKLHAAMMEYDLLSSADAHMDRLTVLKRARELLNFRHANDENTDHLDGVRHNLRVLRNANLPDTRLIICSMGGDYQYSDIDRLFTEPEFADMAGRIVLTAEPRYIARHASANQVISYQRSFINAVRDII